MELVTPVRHLGGMDIFMNAVFVVAAIFTGLVLVTVGVFSILSLLWGDLLESDPAESEVSRAA